MTTVQPLVQVSNDVVAFPVPCRDELGVWLDVGGDHKVKVELFFTRAEIVALLEAYDSQHA